MKIDRTLGIIACYSIADEIVYLLMHDGEISKVHIVSNPEGSLFQEKKIKGSISDKTCFVQPDDLFALERSPGLNVVVWMISASLHEAPSMLAAILAYTVVKISCCVNSIFIGHGLCGVNHPKIMKILNATDVPINFLTYPDGEIADDCFGSFIGGKKQYLDFIKKNKYALFITTGFAEYLRDKHEQQDIVSMVRDIEELKFTLETLGFKRMIKLETSVGDKDEFDKTVSIFSKILGLDVESVDCDLTVFDHSYDLAKRHMSHADHELIGNISI